MVLKLLSEDELRKLASSDLVSIGSHTHGHEILIQHDQPEFLDTINKAEKYISEITGCRPQHFSYPNGDFNARVKELVMKSDYKSAVTVQKGYWSKNSDVFEISRHGIGFFHSRFHFKAIIAGYL